MGGSGSAHERTENRAQNFDWKTWGKRPLCRPRRRWDHNKMNLRKNRREEVDCINLVQERGRYLPLMNTITNVRVPQMEGNFFIGGAYSHHVKTHSSQWRQLVCRLPPAVSFLEIRQDDDNTLAYLNFIVTRRSLSSLIQLWTSVFCFALFSLS